MSGADCVVCGMFPPPTTGAAKNNQKLFDDLTEMGVSAERLSTSSGGTAHRRSLSYHFDRFVQNLKVLSRICFPPTLRQTFYIVPDAGLGAFYSLVHIFAASRKFKSLIIHHRSCRYISNPTVSMSLIVRVAGASAHHVFLSEKMRDEFQATYRTVNAQVVSNAHYVWEAARKSARARTSGSLVIGHLSNLCREKGFYDVVETFEGAASAGLDVVLLLAGPVVDSDVQTELNRIERKYFGRVRSLGPIYGADKDEFYRSIDLFLFPTHHSQEAQPNVIYEALSAGVPVLSTPRGCIPEMVHGCRGDISPTEVGFARFAVDWLAQSGGRLRSARLRDEVRCSIAAECEKSADDYEALLRAFPVGGVRP